MFINHIRAKLQLKFFDLHFNKIIGNDNNKTITFFKSL